MPTQQIFQCPKIQKKNKQIQKEVFEEWGWKGFNGCFCSQCWLREEKGSYDEWVELHTKMVELWCDRN